MSLSGLLGDFLLTVLLFSFGSLLEFLFNFVRHFWGERVWLGCEGIIFEDGVVLEPSVEVDVFRGGSVDPDWLGVGGVSYDLVDGFDGFEVVPSEPEEPAWYGRLLSFFVSDGSVNAGVALEFGLVDEVPGSLGLKSEYWVGEETGVKACV